MLLRVDDVIVDDVIVVLVVVLTPSTVKCLLVQLVRMPSVVV